MGDITIIPSVQGIWNVSCDGDEFDADEVEIQTASVTSSVMKPDGTIHAAIVCPNSILVLRGTKVIIRHEKRKRKFFIITGLPRTRTAWMSAVLSGGDAICFHEPKNRFGSWDAFYAYATTLDYGYIGISDSSISIDPHFPWPLFEMAKVVIIDRNPAEVADSYASFLDIPITESWNLIGKAYDGLLNIVKERKCVHVGYEALDLTPTIAAIWEYCMPGCMAGYEKIMLMQSTYIEQHVEKTLKCVHERKGGIA